eukprot:53792-Hanusia_phi.AAC.2
MQCRMGGPGAGRGNVGSASLGGGGCIERRGQDERGGRGGDSEKEKERGERRGEERRTENGQRGGHKLSG